MKPWSNDSKPKPLPTFKKIDPKLITMTTRTSAKVNFTPTLPDI